MAIIENALQAMESKMKPELVERAKREVADELLRIRLSELREAYKITQVNVVGFSQPAVSKLEKRKDIKLSTLIEYVDALGLNLQIKVSPKVQRDDAPRELILLES